MKRVFVIAGPTASGKSHLALQMAAHLHGEIINADSLQVYRDVPLLTAQPTDEDKKQAPHHLYAYLGATERENCYSWLQRAVDVVKNIETPIFVGGTGLYLKALTEGLASLPDIPDDIRSQVRQMPLKDVLAQLPNDSLRDPQRARRALEIFLTSGHWPSYFHSQPKKPSLIAEFYTIFIEPDRQTLYQRIDARFQKMIEQGALEQVRNLLRANPQKTGGVFQALGVKELSEVIEQDADLNEACARAAQATRHYAKRQLTWFHHQMSFHKIIEKSDISAIKKYL